MKFVALLSGGKDSCFNIIKCTENKHELVALANLMPQQSEAEEINSFMYQSAAHNTIPFMAECFGVPLYRQEILGRAVIQSLDYDRDEADEVEDLFLLLQRIINMHPDIEGVSCGAIVSNYQRLRVENVCSRLNLTPLTYLWMRDRKDLLDEIISSGIVAVLVKVAGAGLDPYKHLGKDLAEMRPILHRLHERFGLDFCGEGGEYESLVLDCTIFKKRLVLLETAVLLDEEDCSVGNLQILHCGVVDKAPGLIGLPDAKLTAHGGIYHGSHHVEQQLQEDNQLVTSIREIMRLTSVPSRYSCKKQSVSDETKDQVKNRIDYKYENLPSEQFYNSFTVSSEKPDGVTKRAAKKKNVTNGRFKCLFGKDGIGQTSLRRNLPVLIPDMSIQDSPVASVISSVKDSREEEAVRQMRAIMLQLKEMIESGIDCDLKDTCFIHLYISDISLFPAVNSEYCKWFGRNPPSRSCVAVPLPIDTLVAADAVFLRGSYHTIKLGRSSRRQVLHVRGISDWAPLCIGPYAQGNVLADSLVYVAGQIPLNPSIMKCIEDDDIVGIKEANGKGESRNIEVKGKTVESVMAELMDSLSVQLVLSLRHAARVLGPLNSSLSRCLGCTVYLNMDMLEKKYGLRLKNLLSDNGSNTCSSSDSTFSNGVSDCSRECAPGGSDMNVCHNRGKDNIFLHWSGWGILSELTQRLLKNNCMETIPGVVTVKRVNADGDSDSDSCSCSDEENMEIEGYRTDIGSMTGASKYKGRSRDDVHLPVLVVGVRGIPRNCLLEVEVISLTDLLPLSSFISSISSYQIHLSPRTSSVLLETDSCIDICVPTDVSLFDSIASTGILLVGGDKVGSTTCSSCIQCQLGSGSVSGVGSDLSLDQLDDLDPDYWPVWYRVQNNTLQGKKVDDSITDSRTAVAVDGDKDLGSHVGNKQQKAELSCDMYTIVRNRTDSNANHDRGDILNDHLCSDSNSNIPPTVDALQNVLVSTVRATECNRCVCSGFSNVHLRESRMDQKNVLKELAEEGPEGSNLVQRIDAEFGVEDGTKAYQDSGERCLMNDDKIGGGESTLQQAANLLFLSVHQQMISAALNFSDLRTFRVYYQPSDVFLSKSPLVEEEVTISAEKSIAEEDEENVNMQNVGHKSDFKNDDTCCESAVEEACLSAIESVFGVHSDTFPLLLIPVTQLAAAELYIEISSEHTEAISTPLLSAQFLFINLLQIKSETWIRGH